MSGYSSDEVANLCRARTEAVEAAKRAEPVVAWAQAVLTALNVGDVQKGSPLHIKLREIMIAYRESQELEST